MSMSIPTAAPLVPSLPATSPATPSRPVSLAEVFGTGRGLLQTYIERPGVDPTFRYHLAQGKHLILYGASSQGKSSLVRRHLDPEQSIEVLCAPTMRRYDVYRLLLREAGVYVSLGRKKKRIKGVSAEVTLYREDTGTESETSEQTINIDLANINDILRVLEDNDVAKTIVLEDFHLLPGRVQRQLAADLKTVYERSRFQVIVVGVWREEDKLSSLSGYLPGRSTSINVDDWSGQELEAVIAAGSVLLNVSLGADLTARLIELSSGNVGLLQQLCYRVCQAAGVEAAGSESISIADVHLADASLRQLVDTTAGRYRLFIERYARRRSRDEQHLAKWIMHGILSQDVAALDAGVAAGTLFDHINTLHTGCEVTTDHTEIESAEDDAAPQKYRIVTRFRAHRGRIDRDRVLKLLSKMERYQRSRDINPIVLSYDKRRQMLRAVDIGLLLFLKSCTRAELLDRLPGYDDELNEELLARAMCGELDVVRIGDEEALERVEMRGEPVSALAARLAAEATAATAGETPAPKTATPAVKGSRPVSERRPRTRPPSRPSRRGPRRP